MFRGRAVHTIDAKGRVSIPVGFRMELMRHGDRAPFLTQQPECLALYPFEAWREIERELEGSSPLAPEVRDLQRYLISGAEECPVDRQGRITIPPHLRVHAGLDKEVTIAGVGPRIEIWDRVRFDQALARTQAQFDALASAVARGGRQA
jgi:MraZ protein